MRQVFTLALLVLGAALTGCSNLYSVPVEGGGGGGTGTPPTSPSRLPRRA